MRQLHAGYAQTDDDGTVVMNVNRHEQSLKNMIGSTPLTESCAPEDRAQNPHLARRWRKNFNKQWGTEDHIYCSSEEVYEVRNPEMEEGKVRRPFGRPIINSSHIA